MQSVITLRNMFEYPQLPAAILFVAILAVGIVYLNLFCKKKTEKPVQAPVAPVRKPVTTSFMEQLKNTYTNKIDEIKSGYETGSISRRECFYMMSKCIREFASEAMNKDITTYTLTDIHKLKKKPLEKLISSYYEPEFGVDKDEDVDTKRETETVMKAIENTKTVISQWK